MFSLKTEASAGGGFFNLVPYIVRGVPVAKPVVVVVDNFLEKGPVNGLAQFSESL